MVEKFCVSGESLRWLHTWPLPFGSCKRSERGMIYPAQNEKLVQKLKEKNITCFAMESWNEIKGSLPDMNFVVERT